MCPQNADDPPLQCRKTSQKRPVDAEEISNFHRALVRHSRGGRRDRMRHTRCRDRSGTEQLPVRKKRPQNAEPHALIRYETGHGRFISRHTVQRRLWRTRQAS